MDAVRLSEFKEDIKLLEQDIDFKFNPDVIAALEKCPLKVFKSKNKNLPKALLAYMLYGTVTGTIVSIQENERINVANHLMTIIKLPRLKA